MALNAFSTSRTELLQYVARETALDLTKHNNITQFFKNHRSNIFLLDQKYKILDSYTLSIMNVFYNKRRWEYVINSKKISFNQALMLIYGDTTQQNKEFMLANEYLHALKDWAKNAYKEIMSFREGLTGQDFVYHILEGETKDFKVDKHEYLNMITNLITYNSDWDKVSAQNLNDILGLRVGSPAKRTGSSANEYDYIGRRRDHLFRAIYNSDQRLYTTKEGSQKKVPVSRLYEIYTQFKSMHKWVLNPDGSIPYLTDRRKEMLEKFMHQYIHQAKLHIESIPFYKMGDSIQNAMTLIENKRAGARISIKTIRDAITELKKITTDMQQKTPEQLAKSLKDMYIAQSGSHFETMIMQGAEKFAEKNINAIITDLQKEGFFKKT